MSYIMRHNDIKLSEGLSRYVKRISSFGCTEYSNVQHRLKFFADGSPGIMFQQGDNPMLLNSSKKLSSIFLYGQTVLPIVLSTSGSYRTVVVFLQPDAMEALFGIPAVELTDACVDLSLLSVGQEFRLTEQMLNSGGDGVKILKGFLEWLILRKKTARKTEVLEVVHLIHQSNGNRKIVDISRELRVSERTLVRNFTLQVGVPPKVYSNICRFQSGIKRLERGHFDSLSGLAYELGYADQSHFNRSFKLYTGETPLEYLKHAQLLNTATVV